MIMKIKEKTHLQFTLTMALAGLSVATSLFAIVSVQKSSVSGDSASVAAIYYVDSNNGNDANQGTETAPWKSLAKIANMQLNGGDQVLLKAGSVWNEKLFVNSSGTSGNPITIKSYGNGAKPLIDGQDQLDYGILIFDRNHIIIKDIAVTGINVTGMAPSTGIAIANSNNVVIDDVNITNVKGLGGIFVYSSVAGRGENNIIKNSTITNTRSSAYGVAGNNMGNGVHLWTECAECGKNNTIENNTITGSGGHGVGVFMPYTIVRDNTVRNNNESGISASGSNAHHTIIDGNTVSGNCQKIDDCFGINLFRSGRNNVVKNNTVSSQKDTINDPSIAPNEGYFGMKFGTGGIRFDGGDSTLINNPAYGLGSDYMSQSGNEISRNTISNEYDAIQVFNYDGIVISGNTISNSDRWAVNASAMNSALGNVSLPFELYIDSVTKALMAKWGGNPPVNLETITKPITVTIQNNTITGKGVNTSRATVIGDVASEPDPEPEPTPEPEEPDPVSDTTPPVVTLVGNTVVTITKGQSWVDPGYVVTDDIDPNPVATISGSVNMNIAGTYVINYSARDVSGNQSATVTRSVTVRDAPCTATRYYRDADGDGYGAGSYKNLCPENAAGYVTNNKDCNDSVRATCSRPRFWCNDSCYKW
jgi:parallel beta-helix repeat protein